MSQEEAVPSITLGAYANVLRRGWKTVFRLSVLGLVAAVGYLALADREATATASVAMNVISADPFNASRAASGLIDTAGEAQVASSSAVAARAAERLGDGILPESVRKSVSVEGVADTAILRVSATAGTAEEAQALANAVATEFLEFRSELAQTRIARTLQQSTEQLDQLRDELRDLDQRIADAPVGSRDATVAQSDRSLLTLQITAVLSEAASTRNIDTSGGTVLSPADSNPVRWTPRRGLVLISGLLVGFALGLMAAFALNATNSRIESGRDVSQNGGAAVLGELVERRATIPPDGLDLAGFRAIRERLLADRRLGSKTGVLVVLDATRGKDHLEFPVNLAYVMARAGGPVECIAVEAMPAQISDLNGRLGLLPDLRQFEGGVRFRTDSNLHFSLVVPDRLRATDADESLPSSLRGEISSRRHAALVIVPVPGSASEATRLAACRIADYALVLVAPGATLVGDLRRVSQDVQEMGGVVLGSVLVPRHRILQVEARTIAPARETAGSTVTEVTAQ